jgi:hypothetical protein
MPQTPEHHLAGPFLATVDAFGLFLYRFFAWAYDSSWFGFFSASVSFSIFL